MSGDDFTVSKNTAKLVDRLAALNPFTFATLVVFYRDLGRTNVQYKELFALLARTTSPRPWAIIDYESLGSLPAEIWSNGSSLISYAPCQNSCLVFSNSPLDLKVIISASGYIQSCGPLIFAAPWYGLDEADFISSLRDYVSASQPKRGRLVFYTVEDFQRGKSGEGIDAIKFHKDKYFIGTRTVSEVMKAVKDTTTPFQTVVERFYPADKEESAVLSTDFSVFTVRDYDASVADAAHNRGQPEPQLLLSYDSLYKKENALHILDEWKPFWPGQYTTPQPLVQAMLALVSDPRSLVIDPFAGSGSVAIAAAAIGYDVITSDLSGIDGIRYNFRFISDVVFREQMLVAIERFGRSLNAGGRGVNGSEIVANAILRVVTETGWHWSKDLDACMEEHTGRHGGEDFQQLLFFLIYRTLYSQRHLISADGTIHFGRMTLHLRDTVTSFANLCRRAFLAHDAERVDGSLGIRVGKYGQQVTGEPPRWGRISVEKLAIEEFGQSSAVVDRISAAARVAVVTDPPYGVNTDLLDSETATLNLYHTLVRQAIALIRRTQFGEGDLIMCTLSQVKIGKRVPEAAYTRVFESVLFKELASANCELITSPCLVRGPIDVLRDGYWKSDKALDRKISSVKIRCLGLG